ncbi:hypothetical protein M501DRAFT_1017787 [Patellaria atrata CBS 101060]|uniref:Uncharacterized protein n=1 Tax=Patellaria atrata CBS 101060 TaxID=1346257 RepID=A0A9P4S999_9PEZI|nr:hypothetical protein M501DRAFT_1017787 [Patellaria atrata CBS 101060]
MDTTDVTVIALVRLMVGTKVIAPANHGESDGRQKEKARGQSYGGGGYGNTGYGDTDYGNSGYGKSGCGNSGYGKTGYGDTSYGNTGYGYGNDGYGYGRSNGYGSRGQGKQSGRSRNPEAGRPSGGGKAWTVDGGDSGDERWTFRPRGYVEWPREMWLDLSSNKRVRDVLPTLGYRLGWRIQ